LFYIIVAAIIEKCFGFGLNLSFISSTTYSIKWSSRPVDYSLRMESSNCSSFFFYAKCYFARKRW